MSDPLSEKLQPLSGHRQNSESDAAVTACNDWLRMGAGRTLVKLIDQYQRKSTYSGGFEPPTLSMSTLKTWSSKFNWSTRAMDFNRIWENEKDDLRKAEVENGLALDFERIRKLKDLADMLESQIFETGIDKYGKQVLHNLWVPDVKQIGSGDNTERVDIERYNSALISDYRAVLDDLAKEVGGRIKKSETDVTSGGEPLRKLTAKDLSDDDLANIANGSS